MIDLKKIKAAVKMLSSEKKIEEEKVIDIIESALKTAYKKDYGSKDEKVNVKLDFDNNNIEIAIEKTVVKEVKNPSTEISIDEAEGLEEGDIVEIDMTDEVINGDNGDSFGRIASQAARQVILQKIGETEKEKLYELFKDHVGEIISMKINLVDGKKVLFEYKDHKIPLPKAEQVSRDKYVIGARMYVLVANVEKEENKAPRVTLSRKRKELVLELFKEFVPEIEDGVVNVDKIVRQPGVKTKMLVSSTLPDIDPVGTLIGQKGIRVKQVMDELFGEKIDIIPNIEDASEVVKKALSPAKVVKVAQGKGENTVVAYVELGERAKALGKGGININLASELTGYTIIVEEQEDK